MAAVPARAVAGAVAIAVALATAGAVVWSLKEASISLCDFLLSRYCSGDSPARFRPLMVETKSAFGQRTNKC